MRALLLPIKDLRNAKQRLVPLLSPEERFAIAQAMLADTIHAVRGVKQADKIFVVTNYAPAMKMTEENGWELLREETQISESVSVDAASCHCAELGVTSLLRLPLDVPLVQASDIDELLSLECAGPTLVIVPSRDGTGTNAIRRTPPALFPSHFGPGSFARHCEAAERAGAEILVRRNARLDMDVDDESDLRVLVQQDLRDTQTGDWLRRSGLLERLLAKDFRDKPMRLAANI